MIQNNNSFDYNNKIVYIKIDKVEKLISGKVHAI